MASNRIAMASSRLAGNYIKTFQHEVCHKNLRRLLPGESSCAEISPKAQASLGVRQFGLIEKEYENTTTAE